MGARILNARNPNPFETRTFKSSVFERSRLFKIQTMASLGRFTYKEKKYPGKGKWVKIPLLPENVTQNP